MIVQLYCRGSK